MDEPNILQTFYAKAEELRSMICHLKVSEQIDAMKLLFSLLEQLQQNVVEKLTFLSGLVPQQRSSSSQSPPPSTEGDDIQMAPNLMSHLTSIFSSYRPEQSTVENNSLTGNSWMSKRPGMLDGHQGNNAKKQRCADVNYSARIEEASSSMDVFNLLLRKQNATDDNEDAATCDNGSNEAEKRTNGENLSAGRRNGTGWLIPPLIQLSMPASANGSATHQHQALFNDSDSQGTHSPPNIVNGSMETTPQLSPINLTMPAHLKSMMGGSEMPLSPSFAQRFMNEPPAPSPPECIPLSITMSDEHRAQANAPISSQQMASIASSLQQLPSLATLFSSRFAPDSSSLHMAIRPMSNISFGQQRNSLQAPANGATANIVSRAPLPFSLSNSSGLQSCVPGHQMGIFPTMNGQTSAALLQQLQAAIRSRRREKVNGRHFCTFPGCMENYASIEHIQDHELQHTVPDGKYLPCPMPGCRERFKWRNYLRVHMKRYHSSLVPPPIDLNLPTMHTSPKPPPPQFSVKIEKDCNEFRSANLANQSTEMNKTFESNSMMSYGSSLPNFDPRLGIGMRAVMEQSPSGESGGSNGRSHEEAGVGLEMAQVGSPPTRTGEGQMSSIEEGNGTSDLAKLMSLGLAAIPADVRAALDGMMQLVPSSYVSHEETTAK